MRTRGLRRARALAPSFGRLLVLVLALAVEGCSSDAPVSASPAASAGAPPATDDGGAPADAGSRADADAGADAADAASLASNLRIVAANISSGPASTYDSGEGIRILKGLRPDVALLQELNYASNSPADLDAFTSEAFGAGYAMYREDGAQIPNAVVSRYPILASGRFVDPAVDNRSFVYAKLDVPGPRDLWAVSVHLLTSGSANRETEATSLAAQLGAIVSDGDYVVIGGDFNTDTRVEPCLTALGALVDPAAPAPADQAGNDFTSAPRTRPYDWVLASAALEAHQIPTVIGASAFPNGLVFDSRVFTPLADVAPVMKTDSDALNMQHMAVVKDFSLPE